MDNYRYRGRSSYDSNYRSGGYYPSGGNYDPYFSAVADPSFDWKLDWPTMVGSMINAQIGR
jgi:hypothetical protein